MTTDNMTHDLPEKSVTTDCTQNNDISDLQNIANEYRQNEIEKKIEENRIAREHAQQRIKYNRQRETEHTPKETHDEAINKVAYNLIENDIPSIPEDKSGIDLVLDNGNTIAVRGASKKDGAIPLVQITIRNLIATHVMIITDMWENKPAFYILRSSDAKRISDEQKYNKNDDPSWFMRHSDYRYYKDNYEVLRE